MRPRATGRPDPINLALGPCAGGLALLAAFLVGTGTARAGDDDDDLVMVRQQQPQVRFQARAMGQVQIADSNIDAWVYGNNNRGPDWLARMLKRKVDQIGRACGLADAQKEKLNLAGQGDIHRFTARVGELKTRCKAGAMPVGQWRQLYTETQPLRRDLARGLFGKESLFHKTLATTLQPEQLAVCEEADRERRNFRYRARIELVVAQLDAILGLRDEQRRALVQLVLDKTRPPLAFGQTDRFVVLAQMSRLPDEALSSLLEPRQWRELQKQLVAAKRTVQVLKQNGMILDDDPEPAKEAAFDAQRVRAEGRRAGN
jgi:hypothetical protein